jgi:hypothetical protein
MRPFSRTRQGIATDLGPGLAPGLIDLLAALSELGDPRDDPAAARLALPVYLGDDAAAAAWESQHRGRIELSRLADRATFVRVAEQDPTVVDDDEARSLVRVLAELRLVLTARFGVEIESDYSRLEEEQAELLDVLGWLQHSLLEELGP